MPFKTPNNNEILLDSNYHNRELSIMKKLKGAKREVKMRKYCIVDLQILKHLACEVNSVDIAEIDQEFCGKLKIWVKEFEESRAKADKEEPKGSKTHTRLLYTIYINLI